MRIKTYELLQGKHGMEKGNEWSLFSDQRHMLQKQWWKIETSTVARKKKQQIS